MQEMLAETSLKTGELSAGVTRSLETTRRSLGLIAGLEGVSRNVEKIVDGFGMVSIRPAMLISGSVEGTRPGIRKRFAVVSGHPQRPRPSDSAGAAQDTACAIQDRSRGPPRAGNNHRGHRGGKSKNVGVLRASGSETDMNQIAAANQQILNGAEVILSLREAVVGAGQVAAAAGRATGAAARAAAKPLLRRAAPTISRPQSRRSPRRRRIQRRNG
jgi:methyl-accepting chemotaxis protein